MSAAIKRAEQDPGQKVKPEPERHGNQQAEFGAPLLYAREDWSLYTNLSTLPQRAGVPAQELPSLVVKEFTDNALDSADAAGHPGAVTIAIDQLGNLIVEDQGTGIPNATPEQIANLFCIARPMVSSKLTRRPTRGCVGNGLRVCLGWLAATRGRLIVETGNLRVELVSGIDGTSSIVQVETIEPREGLKLITVVGDERFRQEHLVWAEDAIELAQQSGAPAFNGRPSPHWMDLDHFRMLACSVVGIVSVRQFLAQFDGLTGSKVQSRIAARFLRRAIIDLSAEELAELLGLAQRETKPPQAQALRPLGRNAVVTGGYAVAEGKFVTGQHEPFAMIPVLVECWADALFPDEREASATVSLFMNRTLVPTSCTGHAWHSRLDLAISGTAVSMPVPSGPHYEITVNITSPMFPMTSDGKTPDCRPFRHALTNAIGKAALQAGKSIAAEMSADQKRAIGRRRKEERDTAHAIRLADRAARQQRQAQLAQQRAERQKLPSIKDVVLELLPGAIEVAAASGYLFNTRHLVYAIRDEVKRRTGNELVQSYFDKIDAMLMSAIGYNTRAARDLIDNMAETAEPVQVFHAHDADAHGTRIHHALQHATLARPARKIQIIDVGLQPSDGYALSFRVEDAREYNKDGRPRRKAVGDYIRERIDRAPTGETWEEWLQHSRFELNAFTSAQLIAWLDQKMAKYEAGKLIPPDDILQDQFSERVRRRTEHHVETAIGTRLDEVVVTIRTEEAEVRRPLLAEIDRVSSPLVAELNRVRAPLLQQLKEASNPFQRRVIDAHAEADAIDRETLVHRVIQRMLPEAEKLRQRIGEVFTEEPTLHWSAVLDGIADGTEPGEIDLDLAGQDGAS